MKTTKIITKSGYAAVVIDNEMSIVKKGDQFFFYPNVTNGAISEDQDCQEFLLAYENHKKELATKKEAEIQAARIKEEERISALKKEIEECTSPVELAERFDLKIVETANHWSDLYEGRSSYAVAISDRKEYEIMSFAKDILNIDGEFGEIRNRAGEHHSTFSRMYNASLEDYQEALKRHFSGDKFFYRDQETESSFYCERIEEIMNDDDLDFEEKLEAVEEIIDEKNKLVNGYYDCNGNLEISNEDLNDPDRSGYYHDVYSYSFAFRFDHKDSFNELEEIEEEEDI